MEKILFNIIYIYLIVSLINFFLFITLFVFLFNYCILFSMSGSTPSYTTNRDDIQELSSKTSQIYITSMEWRIKYNILTLYWSLFFFHYCYWTISTLGSTYSFFFFLLLYFRFCYIEKKMCCLFHFVISIYID